MRAVNRISLEINKLPLLIASISWLLQRYVLVIINARNGIKGEVTHAVMLKHVHSERYKIRILIAIY